MESERVTDKDITTNFLIKEIEKLEELNRELVEAGNDLYEVMEAILKTTPCNAFVGLRLVGVRAKWNKITAKAEANNE